MNKFLIEKKKFPQTSTNSRQNSGEKQITRIMSLKHSKLNTPNSAGGNIKSTIKKKNTNNVINNNNCNMKNKIKSIDKINDINNNKILHHNNYMIPNVNINIDKNFIKNNTNKILKNNTHIGQELKNQKMGNNHNHNSIEQIQKALYNNINKNNVENNNINNFILNSNNNINNNKIISNNNPQPKIKDKNKENDKNNNINSYSNSNNENNNKIPNTYCNENKYEQVEKEEKIMAYKKKILLGKNNINNLPPSSRQMILNKNNILENNIAYNNNNNISNNFNEKGIDSSKKNNNNNHKNKFVNNNINININNNLNNKVINNENNSLEELKNKNKNSCGFNKGLLINRKIMTATNSPSHSIQMNNFNNNNIIINNNINKHPKSSKNNFQKNNNNYNSSNNSNNNSNTNNTNNNGNNTNTNSNTNTNKNDSSDIAYSKQGYRENTNSNENFEKKNQKISEKNTISNISSANNTDNSRKNTTGKIKKNNEKIINKNKIHNYINNHNIINNEQPQNILFNPHHNTLRSNNSINKENSVVDENMNNEKNNNQINNKNKGKIVNNINNNKSHINNANNNNNNKINNENAKINNNYNNDDINYNFKINNYLHENNAKEKVLNNKDKENNKEKNGIYQKQKDKLKLDKLTEKLIVGKLINKKVANKSKGINNNIKNEKFEECNKFLDKEKIEQLLLNKEKLLEYNKKLNNKNKQQPKDIKDENKKSSLIPKVKIKTAKKSTHNRNMDQNFILNNRTNTSVLSTMKDSNYYSHECEVLSKFIKDYYKQNLCYPNTDLSFYKYGRVIGRGAFGKVNIGLNILTGRIVAIKSFNKKNIINESSKKKILYETNLMRGLCHPSVTKILETFESEKYMLIIMEYISGGNLQNFVKKRRKLGEKTAKILFRQIIQGIKYIHSRGIVHRDIKLENILLDLNNIIKICDFGVGKLIKPNTILKDQCGTPVYMAPEIIRGAGYHGFPVDIWSAGIALYIMLSGNLPFNKDKEHDLEYSILNNNIKEISDISEDGNNLLKNILEKDPNKRYTANQILEHPWMNTNLNDDENNDYDYNNEIKNVNKYHLFTNAESILLAKTHIDYRNAQKKDLAENFTIKNLYTIDENSKKNIDTKSAILAPYNSMISDYEESEDNLNTNNSKKNNKSKNSNKNNPLDLLDNYNNELEIKNGLIKFHGKAKEYNMNYELNNNEEIDNGMLINSKNELISVENENENKDNPNNIDKEKNVYLIKNNNNTIKKNNINKKKHRPSSPYRPPPINKVFVKMVSDLGYNEEYVIKCLEKNELNHATAIYYLFSNYENVK